MMQSMDKVSILTKTPLFSSLAAAELKDLAACCVERRLKKGQILFTEGEEARGVYIVAEGALKAFRESPGGREQVIHIERACASIAEVPVFDDQPYPSSVAAEEDSVVLFLDKRDVKRLCLTHPTIALAALRLLAGRLRRCAALVEDLSLKEVDQRLAKFLLQEGKVRGTASGAGLRYRLPPNAQIAAQIGSVREVVSRALTRLQQRKLIDVDGRRNMTILDPDSLEHYGSS
jgi:CRP-like cAMP-binding protein